MLLPLQGLIRKVDLLLLRVGAGFWLSGMASLPFRPQPISFFLFVGWVLFSNISLVGFCINNPSIPQLFALSR